MLYGLDVMVVECLSRENENDKCQRLTGRNPHELHIYVMFPGVAECEKFKNSVTVNAQL